MEDFFRGIRVYVMISGFQENILDLFFENILRYSVRILLIWKVMGI